MEELDAVLAAAATGPCRHMPRTLERAEFARTLRDLEKLPWKDVADRLGCSPATAMYLYRATPRRCSRTTSRASSACCT